MHKIMKAIMIFICVILIIGGLVIFNFYISFGYGGVGGFLAEFRNLPGDAELESLRGQASEQLTQAHAEFSSVKGLALYEKTYSDMCAKGEHNWKRSDSYAYVCSYRWTYYYGTDRDYKNLLLEMEKTLDDLGWKIGAQTPRQPAISEALRKYSGEIFLVELPYYRKELPDSRRLTLVINGFDGYGGYWNVGNNEPDPFGFGIGILQEIYSNGSHKSPEEIFHRIVSSGQEAIMIAISTEYFEN